MSTKIKIVCLAIATAVWLPSIVIAEPYIEPFTPSVRQIIIKQAQIWKTPAAPIIATATCESNLNPKATNSTPREYSVGIAQINLKAHKNITEAQARDVEFAASFMAENFSKGKQSMWSCWTKLYGK